MLKSRVDLFQLFLCLFAEFHVVGEPVGMPYLYQVAICITNLIPRNTVLKAKSSQGGTARAQLV
jgi:hypothetical protein